MQVESIDIIDKTSKKYRILLIQLFYFGLHYTIMTTNNKQIIDIKEGEKLLEKTKLKPNNEKFCQLYLEDGVGVRAYGQAYGLDITNSLQYMVAAAGASRLLKNVKIGKRLNELMTLAGFTDEGVDNQLNFLIQQHDDKKAKLGAIKEYNNLKKRTGQNKSVFQGNTFNLGQLLDRANAIDVETK